MKESLKYAVIYYSQKVKITPNAAAESVKSTAPFRKFSTDICPC
jgi:hypothetical protein